MLNKLLWLHFLSPLGLAGNFFEKFLFFQRFIGLEQFGSPLEFLDFSWSNFVEVFLGVGPNLAQSPIFHMVVDLLPVLAISLEERFKEIRLGGGPSADFVLLGGGFLGGLG